MLFYVRAKKGLVDCFQIAHIVVWKLVWVQYNCCTLQRWGRIFQVAAQLQKLRMRRQNVNCAREILPRVCADRPAPFRVVGLTKVGVRIRTGFNAAGREEAHKRINGCGAVPGWKQRMAGVRVA